MVFSPPLPTELHILQGYKVCEKAVNQNGAQLLLSEQTFSINLKSLITPSLNKGFGVIFFFSSQLIDSNICQNHVLQQTHGKIQYLNKLLSSEDERNGEKGFEPTWKNTNTLCFIQLMHKVNVLYQQHILYCRTT